MMSNFAMIIILAFNSIKLRDKTVQPVETTLIFTSFLPSLFAILVINVDAPYLLLNHFSSSRKIKGGSF